jgi:hypothetical protein
MEIILHSHQFTEDNVKKAHLPPVTSLAVSLSLALGIFAAGLTNSRVVPVAKAQEINYVSVGSSAGTVVGTAIAAKGVVINGVATNAVIPGSVRISDSVVDSACGLTSLGFNVGGDTVYALGVFASGNYTDGDGDGTVGPNGVFASGNYTDADADTTATPNGVFASGNYTDAGTGEDVAGTPNGVFASGDIYVGSNLQVVGGVLSGTNIQVIDGVVTGSDLKVVGGYVSGACGD